MKMYLYRNGEPDPFIDPETGEPMELTPPCRVAGRKVYDTEADGIERLRVSGEGPWTILDVPIFLS